VHETIAADVGAKVEAVIAALESLNRERSALAAGLLAAQRGRVQMANGRDMESYCKALTLIEGEKGEGETNDRGRNS
jgi:hypothetical protein